MSFPPPSAAATPTDWLTRAPAVSARAPLAPVVARAPETLARLMAEAWAAGRIPLLGARPGDEAGTQGPGGASPRGGADDVWETDAHGGDPAPYVAFRTSGSTGKPRLVVKDAWALAREAAYLAPLLGLAAGDTVVSLVPTQHIYGFLFSFFVPWQAGVAACWLADDPSPWPDAAPAVAQAPGGPESVVLVAVPALWTLVEALQSAAPLKAICFSGAPLGEGPARRWRAMAPSPTVLREFLGSTETGGFAYRCVRDGTEAFRLFEGARLTRCGDRWHLLSPFMPETAASPLPLADRFAWEDDGRHFRHLGREDGVFKHKGQRFSRQEVEARMSALYGGGTWRCFFEPDPAHAKGGRLTLFVSGMDAARLAGIRRLMAHEGLPSPDRILLADALPLDAMGKLSLPAVERVSRAL